MHNLSVTILTLNEESNIGDCLESVKWADEIVVVDSNSTDRTVEICRKYTDKIFLNPWPGMNEQNNFARERCSHEWILSIDADESIPADLQKKIKKLLEGEPKHDGYSFPRKNLFLGRWIRYGGWYPDYVLRLYKKNKGVYGGVNPHGKIILDGKEGKIDSPIIHKAYINLSQYIIKQNSYSSVASNEMYKTGKRINIGLLLIKPISKFLEVYLYKRGFLDGVPGLYVSVTASYFAFLKYAKLMELYKNRV